MTTILPQYNDGKNPIIIPAGPAGSPQRIQAWANYWAHDGTKGQTATRAEYEGVINELLNDIENHKAQLAKYESYRARGLHVDQAIAGVQYTITSLYLAVNQKRIEASKAGITL